MCVRRWLGWLKVFPHSWQKYCPWRMRDLSIPEETQDKRTAALKLRVGERTRGKTVVPVEGFRGWVEP